MADDLKKLFRAGKAQRGLDNKPNTDKYKKSSSELKPSGKQPQQSQLPADFFAADNQKHATAVEDNNIDQDYAELMKAAHQQKEEQEPAPQPSSAIPKDNDDTQQQEVDTVPGDRNEDEAAQEEEERREFEQFVRQQRLKEIKRAAAEKRRIELDPLILDNDDASIPLLSLIGPRTNGSRDRKKKKLAHTIAALENIGSGSDTDSSEKEEEFLDWRAKRVKEGRNEMEGSSV
jgi:hypothetical protein